MYSNMFSVKKVTLIAFMMFVLTWVNSLSLIAQTTMITEEVTDDYAIIDGIHYERVRTLEQLESIPGIEIVNKRKLLKPNQNPNWDNIAFRLTIIGKGRKPQCPCKKGNYKCFCMVVDYENSELKVFGNDSNANSSDDCPLNSTGYTRMYFNSTYDAVIFK